MYTLRNEKNDEKTKFYHGIFFFTNLTYFNTLQLLLRYSLFWASFYICAHRNRFYRYMARIETDSIGYPAFI